MNRPSYMYVIFIEDWFSRYISNGIFITHHHAAARSEIYTRCLWTLPITENTSADLLLRKYNIYINIFIHNALCALCYTDAIKVYRHTKIYTGTGSVYIHAHIQHFDTHASHNTIKSNSARSQRNRSSVCCALADEHTGLSARPIYYNFSLWWADAPRWYFICCDWCSRALNCDLPIASISGETHALVIVNWCDWWCSLTRISFEPFNNCYRNLISKLNIIIRKCLESLSKTLFCYNK